jgi:hypothetical protein
MVLAQTFSVVLGVITLLLILVQNVILTYNLTWKAIVIFLGAILAPFIAAYLFRAVKTRGSSK